MTAIKDETASVNRKNYSDHSFLVMWCNEGLECVVDITAHEKAQLWNSLKGDKAQPLPNLNAMIMRARYNTQRHYEIYIVNAVEGITADDLSDMFKNSPQHAADLIRSRGAKIYSDRADTTKVVIV